MAEVAERLKVNPQTVRNWIDRGELLSVRAGARRVRVRPRDLEAFLGGSQDKTDAREAFTEALNGAQAARDER